MYLESFKIENYRKFGKKNNTIYFVAPCPVETQEVSDGDDEDSVVGPSTTLIIGKNNAGKTTIANALKLICDKQNIKASDFNIKYLNSLLNEYKQGDIENKCLPELNFTLRARVDFTKNDLLTNLSDFITAGVAEVPEVHDPTGIQESKEVLEPIEKSEPNGLPEPPDITDSDDLSESVGQKIVIIKVKVEISEASGFRSAVKQLLDHAQVNELDSVTIAELFYQLLDQKSDFLELDEDSKLFKMKFINLNNTEVKNFSLKELMHLREIKANRHLKKGVLSEVFNKIIRFQFDNDKAERGKLEDEVKTINKSLTDIVKTKSSNVSDVLRKIENKNHVDLDLKGDVTYESIVKNLIKYNFSDAGDFIPEEQFGLGYINLLNIIGEIIHYVDSYQHNSFNSHINILFIEEPEAFMHPQMQEFFVNRIDKAVHKALEIANKAVKHKKVLNCQIAITTHSSHIVNSKIHSSRSFNNINYLSTMNKDAMVVNLNDEVVSGEEGVLSDNLKFIKKHIKYKVSELFFSDAVLFVEGVTEEALLQFYLEKEDTLKDNYISVFNINGAHGKVYFPLIKALKVPCLVITDLDIQRNRCERGVKHKKSDDDCTSCGHNKDVSDTQEILDKLTFKQVTSLVGLKTTNNTLIEFNKKTPGKSNDDAKKLDGIEYFSDENLYITFQKKPIQGFHATSLEEAFILTNYDNDILNETLKVCKKNTYKDIVDTVEGIDTKQLIENSFKLQRKLSDSKSNFSSELLYKCIVAEVKLHPELPCYIKDGFNWLSTQLTTSPSDALIVAIDLPPSDALSDAIDLAPNDEIGHAPSKQEEQECDAY